MTYQSIDVRKLTPTIGAEVFGVDLAKPLGNQQFQEVHDALMDNLVIFFRDQKMSIDRTKSAAGCRTSIPMRRSSSRSIPRSW
jgi:taurine dioxygenase